jgi:general secretion pathway protein D
VERVERRGETVSLEFDQAPVMDVVHALLGDLLKLDFVVAHVPQGAVSLRTGGPVPLDSILPIVESMLQANGAALVRDQRGVFHVTQLEGLGGHVPGLYRPDSLPQGYGLVAVPLRFIGASEMAEILKPVAPAQAIVRVDAVRNVLLLAGTQSQHEGWMEIVRAFDVDLLSGMSLGIFPLEFAAVDDVHDALKALLAGVEGGGRDELAAAAKGAVRVLPVRRLNAIVVVSPRAEHLDTVRAWIERLDQSPIGDLEPRLYVYPVQSGSAAHLAKLLNSLYGAALPSVATRPGADSGVAPGLVPTALGGGAGAAEAGSEGATVALPTPEPGTEALTTTQLGAQGDVRVVADEQNNALLILASRRDYRKIEAALSRLDVAPVQIMIEASIVEVTLTGELRYGLEWAFNNRLGGGRTGVGLLNPIDGEGIRARQPGFSYSVIGPRGNIQAVLNALAADSLLRVLSSPTLLVQDNHTASIHVGDQQPIRTGETLTNVGVTTSFEYRDTGVVLSVTPSANAGGVVSMNIHQAVTDVGPVDSATNQRSFLQRQIRSRVAVRSGETVVMGGLMRERNNDGRAGVPILHDIPVIGNLFGNTRQESNRTELLVLITPRVINTDAELRAIGDELRERLQSLRWRPSEL